jgi:uncharacterized protein
VKDSLSIGDLRADPGSKTFGFLKIGESPTAPIQLPVGIINGSKEGPRLCIIAGTHPCEYPGIDAAISLYHDLEPSQLRGSVVTIPVVNVLSFDRYVSYVSPIDQLNMHFQAPGKLDGNFSQLTNYYVEKIAYDSDCFLDLHGAELNELLASYTIFYKTGNAKVDEATWQIARLFGTEYIELRTENGTGKFWPTSTIFIEALKRGIPSIVVESGIGLGSYDQKDTLAHIEGVKKVLQFFKMIDGQPGSLRTGQKTFDDAREIRVRHGGLFYPMVKVSEVVKRDQKIGYVRDLSGKVVEEIHSPVDGFVQLLVPRHVVNSTDVVFYIGMNVTEVR